MLFHFLVALLLRLDLLFEFLDVHPHQFLVFVQLRYGLFAALVFSVVPFKSTQAHCILYKNCGVSRTIRTTNLRMQIRECRLQRREMLQIRVRCDLQFAILNRVGARGELLVGAQLGDGLLVGFHDDAGINENN